MAVRRRTQRLVIFAFLATFLAIVNASVGIRVPANFTADTSTLIKVNTYVSEDSELRKRFNAFRLYLATEPPGWGIGPVCRLGPDQDLDEREVNVTIPADSMPDGSKFYISAGLCKAGASRTNGFHYSGATTLRGGNGTWSQRERDGWVIDSDDVACEAFGCVRACYAKWYSGDKTRISNGTGDDETEDCARQCKKDFPLQGLAATSNLSWTALFGLGFAVILAVALPR